MVSKKHAYVEELEARLIRDIRSGRASSRRELANRHKLAPSTVGIYIDRLIGSGYLREEFESPLPVLRPGRPVQILSLRGESGCFVGVDFEARNIQAICVDFSGQILSRHHVELAPGTTAAHVLQGLEAAISSVLATSHRLMGIGVGVPGLVDPIEGVARHYRFIEGWQDIPVAGQLQERFQVPIVLENTVRATAMGIMLFEPEHTLQNFVCLLVRSGVGAGVIANGELKRGCHNVAGEVGRISFPRTGSAPRRSLEDEASLNSILHYIRDHTTTHPTSILTPKVSTLSIEDVMAAAQADDPLALEALEHSSEKLGWLAHVLALVEDPEAIVLSGPLNAMGEWLRSRVQTSLEENAAHSLTQSPPVLLSALGREAGSLGAVSLAMESWKPAHR